MFRQKVQLEGLLPKILRIYSVPTGEVTLGEIYVDLLLRAPTEELAKLKAESWARRRYYRPVSVEATKAERVNTMLWKVALQVIMKS